MLFYVIIDPPGKFIWMNDRVKSIFSMLLVTTIIFLGLVMVSDLMLSGVMMFSRRLLPFL